MQKISILCALVAATLLCVPGSATAEDFKVGFIYVSPVGDAGYSYAHDRGRQAVEKMDGVSTSYVESVPEGPDAERVLLNMSRKGFDLIFATSYGYMDPVINVAKRFPETTYMHCSGFKQAPNVGTYFGRMYQARYLTGMVAGAMTDSDLLGYVAAYPIPELIRGINAFALGAQAVNPEAKVRVVWTKSWYDPATEKEAALSLLDVGADVIAQHVDSPAPQEAAEQNGAYSIGYNSNMAQFAPEAHLTSAMWKWENLYPEIVEDVQNGTWESEDIWAGLDAGIVGLAPFGPMVPEDVQTEVNEAKQAIHSDQLQVFAGPLKDQEGTVRVPEGKSMSDQEMLGMTWFVQGVIGTTE